MAGGNFAGGDGTAESPFLIEDAHDFNMIRAYAIGYHFQLIRDINLNIPPYNTGEGWTPIPFFSGQIDGQGHKISSLRVWSKGNDVGLFLESDRNFKITNTHFDDIYMELISEDTRAKKFTLFGVRHAGTARASFNSVCGCSFQGKFKIESPNVTARIIAYDIYNSTSSSTGYPIDCFIEDTLFDLENIGSNQINILGYSRAVGSRGGSAKISVNRSILKCKGNFALCQLGNRGQVSLSDAYIVDDINTEYTYFPGATLQTPEFLSKPKNLPEFAEVSYLGQQTWYFPGTTHVRMKDYSDNKFLIEADNKLFSWSAEHGLYRVGKPPVITNTFVSHGIDYIESIPLSVWSQLKQEYESVKVHCYINKTTGKHLETNKEELSFVQAVGNKVVMRSTVDFSQHNDDIYRIRCN